MNLRKGREIHGQALKLRLCSTSNPSVKLKLIELNGTCGELGVGDADKVFYEMPEKDVALTIMHCAEEEMEVRNMS